MLTGEVKVIINRYSSNLNSFQNFRSKAHTTFYEFLSSSFRDHIF
jgi:hypothetical protein